MSGFVQDRFSLLYLERGEPTRDSERFRNRLAAYYEETITGEPNYQVVMAFKRETGASVPQNFNGFLFGEVFRRAEIRDVLDAVTIIYRVLQQLRFSAASQQWRNFVARVMLETNIGYSVDAGGIVHFRVDEEFERNRIAAVAVLEGSQFRASRAALDDAYRHLDGDPADTKASVRSMFESLEILAKQIVPGAKNLNGWLVRNTLQQRCTAAIGYDTTEGKPIAETFNGMAAWVDGLHLYRHGQASSDPVAPSLDTAVLILSTGTAYLRQIAICAGRLDAPDSGSPDTTGASA